MAIIQVRGVSQRAHRRLRARASREGRSLSEYLRLALEEMAASPTLDEALARAAELNPVGGEPASAAIRAGRRDKD